MRRLLAVLIIAMGAFGPAAQAVADVPPYPVIDQYAKYTRVAYVRQPGGKYLVRAMPLFDIVSAAGVVRPGTSSGGASATGNNQWTGTNRFTDSLFTICDDGDLTKCIAFQASGITTGNTVAPISFGGTAAAPTATISGGQITIQSTGNGVLMNSAGTALTTAGHLAMFNGGQIGWGSAASASVATVPDAFFKRAGAAASIQMGANVNGAAVNQTLKAHDGITGTDIKGASLILAPGVGTGAAASNPLTLNRVNTLATGTTAQTYSPAVITCQTKILSNTSATAQTIATITTTTTTGGSATVDYTVVANNGTLQDVDGGLVKVAWGNNAGTVTATMTAVAVQADADASGTLAATPTVTNATNVVSIKLTPTWVTIVPTSVIGIYTLTLAITNATDVVACQ